MSWLVWRTWLMERPFERENVTHILTHLAAHVPEQVSLVFEARGIGGQVTHHFAVERDYSRVIGDAMQAHGNIRFFQSVPRKHVAMAARLGSNALLARCPKSPPNPKKPLWRRWAHMVFTP